MDSKERALGYSADSDIVRVKPLEVGENLTLAIGRAHTLESAVSDLIDNSISHAASEIKVRFLESESRVLRIRIRDDGTGMDSETLDKAMRMNPADRKYSATDLGMFGQGMKASSMSQARELSIFTSPKNGEFFGTRLLRADAGGGLEYGELSFESAKEGYLGHEREITTGTVIEWSQLENVSLARRREIRDEWLTEALTNLRLHLGLVFHRFLEAGTIRIVLERFDLDRERPGAPVFVKPIDPFKFESSGHEDFPRVLEARIPNHGLLKMECHIIPPGSKSEAALLMGRERQKAQGLYVYWRNRLVHFGDWGTLATVKKELQLARTKIDLPGELLNTVRLNPEKAQLVFRPEFLRAAHVATDPEQLFNFESYLAAAQDVLKLSNTRSSGLKPVTRINSGIPDAVIETIEATVGWRPSHNAISFEWGFLPNDQLFDFDSNARKIRLNSRHRVFLSATEANRHEDAPIVRTLLFLLLESYFAGGHIRKTTEDQIKALSEIASSALKVQLLEIEDHNAQIKLSMQRGFESHAESPEEPKTIEKQAKEQLKQPEIGLRTSQPIKKIFEASGLPSKVSSDAEQKPEAKLKSPKRSNLARGESKASREQEYGLPTGELVIDILKQYRRGVPILQIAGKVGVFERAVVSVLALALFGDGSTDNQKEFAPRHGVIWDPTERRKASILLQQGHSVPSIAEKLGRTPLSVSWQLLDGPKPLIVPDSVIKKFQRSWRER